MTDATHLPGIKASLRAATEEQYAQCLSRCRHNEIWWYFNGLAPYHGFSLPFRDDGGRWWYCVKPKFAWPISFFEPFGTSPRLPLTRALLGCQYPVAAGCGNSRVWQNVIVDLSGYGLESVASNKRRAVRKGLRQLEIRSIDPSDSAVIAAASEVWSSHVTRTHWNTVMRPARFADSWRELGSTPGTTVLGAFDPQLGGSMCSWLISRIIGETVYVDTIASHSDRQANRPNDAIIFSLLASAAEMGIRHAHYSLVSQIGPLERFKRSLGFAPVPFECRLNVRAPVACALRWLKPNVWSRLVGEGNWDRVGEDDSQQTD